MSRAPHVIPNCAFGNHGLFQCLQCVVLKWATILLEIAIQSKSTQGKDHGFNYAPGASDPDCRRLVNCSPEKAESDMGQPDRDKPASIDFLFSPAVPSSRSVKAGLDGLVCIQRLAEDPMAPNSVHNRLNLEAAAEWASSLTVILQLPLMQGLNEVAPPSGRNASIVARWGLAGAWVQQSQQSRKHQQIS